MLRPAGPNWNTAMCDMITVPLYIRGWGTPSTFA